MNHRSTWNWLISVVINLTIIAAVFYSTDLVYESNDDFAISQEIMAGYPFVGFVNYYLCKVLIFLQGLLPDLNAFVLSQIVTSFIALVVILKVYLDRRDSLPEVIAAVFLVGFFSFDHYSSVQFTKTAALIMTAGLLLVVDEYINERNPLGFISGFLLFWLGVSYRQKGMFPAMAYAAFFMIIWWGINGREFFRGRRFFKETGLVILILAVLLGAYGFDRLSDSINESTPELRYAREYQAERILVTDYPMMEHFEENEKRYRDAGLNYNDLDMIDRWIFDYDGAASLENLKIINEINKPHVEASKSVSNAVKKAFTHSFNSMLALDYGGMHFIIITLIALYMLFTNKPKAWLYALSMILLSIIIYSAIYYMQRPQYRALYVADESTAFWLMFAAMVSEKATSKFSKAAGVLILAGISAVMIWMTPNAISRLDNMISHNAGQVEAPAVTEYFAENTDNYYIGPTTIMRQPISYTKPLSPPLAPVNVSGTGGWETLSPYKLGLLGKYGVKNPITDLIDAENIYYFSNSKIGMLGEYYNKWYCEDGEVIEFVKVDEIDGNDIFKVVKWQN